MPMGLVHVDAQREQVASVVMNYAAQHLLPELAISYSALDTTAPPIFLFDGIALASKVEDTAPE